MDCGNKRREPPPPSADRSHYNGADCQKKYVRQSCQEIFALDIPFIELLITPDAKPVAGVLPFAQASNMMPRDLNDCAASSQEGEQTCTTSREGGSGNARLPASPGFR